MANEAIFDNNDLLYLLYRVREPIAFMKGTRDNPVYFDVNAEFLDEVYADNAVELLNRVSETKNARRIAINDYFSPELKETCDNANLSEVPRQELFSIFIPKHADCAGRLISIFLDAKNPQELMALAAYCHDRVNSQLYVYALSSALMHRKDTRNVTLPNFAELFPANFIDPTFLNSARERANVLEDGSGTAIEIPIDFTGRDSDPEHKLAYFREDLGVNLHHWHWHLVYPFQGPDVIVKKDRRGELFAFMHRQIMARYNVERLCNNMNAATRLTNLDEPIPEAYYSKLNTDIGGKGWPGRPANLRLRDIRRLDQTLSFDIEDLRRFITRSFDAINRKRMYTENNEEVRLDNLQGIDILGNAVEASTLSVNPTFYGNLHNMGHLAISYIHDPANDYKESPGVMGSSATAMRDPVFYRWHATIDDIFQEHKNTLPPYTAQELSCPGIRILSASVQSDSRLSRPNPEENVLYTFFKQSEMDMTRGLDFTPQSSVLIRIDHLDHDEFNINVIVINETSEKMSVTVRVFIAPVLQNGDYSFLFEDHRNYMIELDKFVADVPVGESAIVRKSIESASTIPYEQTFRNLDDRPADLRGLDSYNYCGCGWPQHMLLPRGTESGFPCVLFVMLTDYRQDQLVNYPADAQICRTGVNFCGLRDSLYPDRKPMNFPFDRRSNASRLLEFVSPYPNMFMQKVTITHLKERRQAPNLSRKSVLITDITPQPAADRNPTGPPQTTSTLRPVGGTVIRNTTTTTPSAPQN